jgi:hypothetical protein
MRKAPYTLSSPSAKHRQLRAIAVLKYRVVNCNETGAAG